MVVVAVLAAAGIILVLSHINKRANPLLSSSACDIGAPSLPVTPNDAWPRVAVSVPGNEVKSMISKVTQRPSGERRPSLCASWWQPAARH